MPGAGYSASGEQNLSSSAITMLTVVAAAASARRAWVDDMDFGNEGTPADLAGSYVVNRCTDEGTNTDVTPTKDDPADIAATYQAGENHTVEPTYSGGIFKEFVLNHRGTWRWTALPGDEFVLAATTTDGFGITSLHASATTLVRAGAHWVE